MHFSISRVIAMMCLGFAIFGAAPGVANAVTVQPALVRDVDEGALQPFQVSVLAASNSSGQQAAYFSVPAGKRLVIEYYSAQAQDLQGGNGVGMTLGTSAGGVFAAYIVYVNATTTNQVTQTTRIYADPGTQVQVFVFGPGTHCGGLITISGYLVNLP